MAITYVNRKGKTFYLHQGVTKKGNPRYYFAQKSEGELADRIPEGFEIYENPHAQVFLRRIPLQLITDAEVAAVRQGLERYCSVPYPQIEVKKNIISIFLPDQDVDALSEILKFAPGAPGSTAPDTVLPWVTYSPRMRFVLIEDQRRRFVAERYCFRGAIDDWIEISKPGRLPRLVKRYVRYLGRDSFYELS